MLLQLVPLLLELDEDELLDEELEEDELDELPDELEDELELEEERRQSPLLILFCELLKQIGSEPIFVLEHSFISLESSHLKPPPLLHMNMLSTHTEREFGLTVPHLETVSFFVIKLAQTGSESLFKVAHSFVDPASQLDVRLESTHTAILSWQTALLGEVRERVIRTRGSVVTDELELDEPEDLGVHAGGP